MKKFAGYVPLHFLLFYGCGVILQYYFAFWNFETGMGIAFFVLIILVFLFAGKKTRTMVAYAMYIALGLFLTYSSDESNSKDYYKYYLQEGSLIKLRITEVLRSNLYNDRYYGGVVQVDHETTSGKILLNVAKDSVRQFSVDDEIYFSAPMQDISPPKNPYDFDYQSYLKRQGVYQQVFLKTNEYLHQKKEPHTLKGHAKDWRNQLSNSLERQGFSEEVLSVLQALLLGQRNDLSNELKEGYARAGAIHILAISGLHIGILMLILNFLFRPLEALPKGSIIKTILVISILWMFALLTGLSASVVRAVTMFSFVAIGLLRNSKASVYHALIASMLCLLLCKPMFLFEVGFQMSYLAVFSIVWLQPKIYNILSFRIKIFDYCWQLLSVSFAAQVLILPLSIYYFHQVPLLFWLTNLMVIPFLGIILGGGIFIMLLGLLHIQIPPLLFFLEGLIGWMNKFIGWIARQEQFLIDGLYLSESALLLGYCLIIAFLLFLQKKSYKYVVLGLIAIIGIQGQFFVQKVYTLQKTEFMVFHKRRGSLMATRKQNRLQLITTDTTMNSQKSLEAYLAREHIESVAHKNPSNIYFIKEQAILLVDSLGVYTKSIKDAVILLTNSPKINMERMIEEVQPIQIIADASNYRSYVERWKETSRKCQIPFHSIAESGMYVLD